MAQKDPMEPPPPPVGNAKLEAEMAAQDAQNQYDWELQDAQDKSKQIKPLFANRIYAEPVGRTLRVSFGERIGDETILHSAIVVPLEEAVQMGDLLFRMANAGLSAQLDEFRNLILELDKPKPPTKDGNG